MPSQAPYNRGSSRAVTLCLYWLPLLAWMGMIYYLSSQPVVPHPGRRIGVADSVTDYAAHALIFGVLTVLAWRFLSRLGWPSRRLGLSPLVWAAVGAGLYGLTDELHQLFVPGRWGKATDWLADLCGIALAVLVLRAWENLGRDSWRPRRHA